MPRPLVAILSLKGSPHAEPESLIENQVLADTAEARLFPVEADVPIDSLPQGALGADALILWHGPSIGAAHFERMKACKVVIRNGVGFDTVDIAAAAARGIPVCNVPDYGTEEVADHAIALTLALCRRLVALDAEAKSLGWRLNEAPRLRRLRTLTFGILGLGRIGTAAALRAKALGFRVIFHDPYVPAGTHKAIGVERVASLEELLRASDVLSIHCPSSAETRGMIGEREIALMKPSAYVVNTARGDIVRKAPLFQALREGRIAGAGLDVVENEPLRTKEEAQTPNLMVTCHAAFCSVESAIEMRTSSARIARAAIRGEPVWNRVN